MIIPIFDARLTHTHTHIWIIISVRSRSQCQRGSFQNGVLQKGKQIKYIYLYFWGFKLLKLWPGNHVIWCNATYNENKYFKKVSNWVYLWLSWSYISLSYLTASLKLYFLQCNLIYCTPHEAKMWYKLVYKCNVLYLKNKINKNTILMVLTLY